MPEAAFSERKEKTAAIRQLSPSCKDPALTPRFLPFFSQTTRFRLLAGWRLLRPRQWSKNVLVLVPLLTAHRAADLDLWGRGLTAMVAFSCCASLGYVVNDWRDLPHDRRHPLKKTRPFAAGLPVLPAMLVLLPGLLLSAGLLGASLGGAVLTALAAYTLLSSAYTFWFKRFPVLDVAVLAVLYTARLWVGGLATHTPVSPWLLAFALSFFGSLALLKRVAALVHAAARGETDLLGRPYRVVHQPILSYAGAACGGVAGLVLVFYVQSATVARLYARPLWLWPVVLVVLLQLVRFWWLARRGRLVGDPVLFALRDPVGYGLLLVGACFVWAAL